METKVCTKCGKVKPLDLFGNQKEGKGGKCSICKECHKDARRAWIERNPQKHAAHEAKQRENRKPQRKEARKRWEERNHEKVAAKKAAWQRKNSERLADSYLRRELKRSLGCSTEVANELIELKRQKILILRETKKLINVIKEQQDEH